MGQTQIGQEGNLQAYVCVLVVRLTDDHVTPDLSLPQFSCGQHLLRPEFDHRPESETSNLKQEKVDLGF